MKKYYILLVAMLSVHCAMGQWVQQNSGTSTILSSVFFVNADTGYVVGWNGTILKTINGGSEWTQLVSGTETNLNSVFFTNANTGFAVGDQYILKTIDGGSTWNLWPSDVGSLLSVFFPNDSIGYAAGYDGGKGVVLKTTNGGSSWEEQSFSSNINSFVFLSVFFTDENTGYVGGVTAYDYIQQNRIFKTINGGITWQLLSNSPVNICSIYFPNDSTGYTVGWNEKVYKTKDAGETWEKLNYGTGDGLWSVYFVDKNIGYAVGSNGSFLKTENGGDTMIRMQTGITSTLCSVFFISVDTGYAVGWDGKILKTTNGGGEPIPLDVSPKNQNVSSSAGTTYFLVNCDTNWSVTNNSSWCNVTTSGSGSDSIIVAYSENTSDTLRVANIEVFLPSQPFTLQNVTVTQSKQASGIDGIRRQNIQIYPNPSSNDLIVETLEFQPSVLLSIINLHGQQLITSQITESKTHIDISTLPNGVYFVRLTGNKTVEVARFVKN